MKKIKFIALLCLSNSLFVVNAQDPSLNNGAWTLQQCIDYAMTNNLDLRLKQLAVESSDVELTANKAALFPTLSASTNQNVSWRPWSESYTNLTDGSLSTTHSTTNYNGTYGLQSQWTVWNGGINRKQVKRSKISIEQSQADEEMTRLDLQEQIAQLYVQILYQTEAEKVCKEILASTIKLEERAQQMYEVGTMSRADLAQMKAQVSQEEYNVTNAGTQLANYKLQLKKLLEIVDETPFEVVVPAIDNDIVMQMLPAQADVYQSALALRPEIRYNQLSIDAANVDIDIAKRGYYPTIGMNAGINTSASSGMKNNWANQIKNNLSNMIGLTVSVPIFDQKRNSTNVAKAKIEKMNAEINMARQEKELYNDIATIWLNASNAQQQYSSAIVNVESMRESYQLVTQQFEVGLKDIVDLTTGKNNLIQAEQQMLQARYTAVLNRALLAFYQGETIKLN